LVFTGLAIAGQFLEVKYGRDSYYPHLMPFFAALVLLPPSAFGLVVVIPHTVEWIKRQLEGNPYSWYIQPFNIATHIIAGISAQWVFLHLGGTLTEFSLQSTLMAAIPALLTYVAINHLLIGQILVLARRVSWSESRVLAFEALATDTAMMSLGYVAALLWVLTPWLVLLVLAPFGLFYRALKVPELEKQNQLDAKTGLWNARYFSGRLEEELAMAQALNRPLTVIMADLDLLRNINNTYGHLAGDVVIAGIGDIIVQTIRKEDIACRFGGEEYAILLPNVDSMTATAIAERIRQTVEITPFQAATCATAINATMSLGIACFPYDGQSATNLLHEADVALYQAKVQGRNRVVTSTEVPHSARLLFDEAQTRKMESADRGQTSYPLAAAPTETATTTISPVEPSATPSGNDMAEPSWTNLPSQPGPESHLPPREVRLISAKLWIFVGSVIAVGLLITLFTLLYDDHHEPLPLIVFAALAFGAQWLQIEMYEKSAVSTSMAIILAATVVAGATGLLAASTAVVIVHTIRMRPRPYKILFNWSTHLIAGLGPLLAIHTLDHYFIDTNTIQFLLLWIAPVLAASGFYYFAETGLVATAIALSERTSIFTSWREQFRWLAQHYLVMGVLGFFLALAYMNMGIVGVLVFSVPILIMHLTQKEYVQRTENSVREFRRMNQELSQANHEIAYAKESIEQLNEELFLTLAKIIDARDPYVSGHATQVGEYAQAIAQEMGLDGEKIAEIYRAGLLHDIGKIGIPEKILHKPERLTAEEYEIVKRHAALGAEFLEACHNLCHMAPYVRHHHERWDGTGYPGRLRGEEIPLESRILAVCDAVEAMASDRPYQAGKPLDKILHEVNQCAGGQFDPAVVDAFIRVLEHRPEIILNSAIAVSQNQFARRTLQGRGQVSLEQLHPGWAY
jgi:diguanylate cyclase (GGDEF)-like protein/putative nucleotidyltransferase with HDIG domain